MRVLTYFSICFTTSAAASVLPRTYGSPVWNVANFKSLITFGDSYTDENRLNYFIANNGTAPPPGTFLPESFSTASGGRTWPRYVIQYTGKDDNGAWDPQMTLYNYAVSGAVCSNDITPRLVTADFLFPDVLGYEVPAFKADLPTKRNGTNQPYFDPALTAENAVYAMWIGTNDLGVNAFLTDSQIRGKTLTDYTDCVYQVFDQLYESGARIFVLFSNAPLHLAPLYANDTLDGVAATHYWPDKPDNHTAIAELMHEYTTTTNNVFRYQTPFEAVVSKKYPGAHFAFFNVWQLMSDIYDNPTAYLNGTQPANVTGFDKHCSIQNDCYLAFDGKSPDSFLWYDELHKSEQTDRVIAKNFIEVLDGKSAYAQYY